MKTKSGFFDRELLMQKQRQSRALDMRVRSLKLTRDAFGLNYLFNGE